MIKLARIPVAKPVPTFAEYTLAVRMNGLSEIWPNADRGARTFGMGNPHVPMPPVEVSKVVAPQEIGPWQKLTIKARPKSDSGLFSC
jgi:hypothetical protein